MSARSKAATPRTAALGENLPLAGVARIGRCHPRWDSRGQLGGSIWFLNDDAVGHAFSGPVGCAVGRRVNDGQVGPQLACAASDFPPVRGSGQSNVRDQSRQLAKTAIDEIGRASW